MKKIIMIALAAVLAVPMFAGEKLTPEERANADYSSWLPAAGDWQIGFSLDPIATFGNVIFNGGAGNAFKGGAAAGYDFAGEGIGYQMASFMGSYMLTDKLSAKLNVGLNINIGHDGIKVQDDAAVFANPMSLDKVDDVAKWKDCSMTFAAGVEYRVGEKRIQGVFGGGVMYGFNAINTLNFSYGNAVTEANQNPSISSDAAWLAAYPQYATSAIAGMPNARPTKISSTGEQRAGLYGSIGVEYFVAPKVAIGANVNLNICYRWNLGTYTTFEGWSASSNQLVTEFTDLTAPAKGQFNLTTENIGANLYMAFYF